MFRCAHTNYIKRLFASVRAPPPMTASAIDTHRTERQARPRSQNEEHRLLREKRVKKYKKPTKSDTRKKTRKNNSSSRTANVSVPRSTRTNYQDDTETGSKTEINMFGIACNDAPEATQQNRLSPFVRESGFPSTHVIGYLPRSRSMRAPLYPRVVFV